MSHIDPPIELQWWGEDGDMIAAPGHHNLTLFTELADAEYALQYDDPGGTISDDFTAAHRWYVIKPFEHDDGDEAYFPCEADTPDALAFTVIETGA